MKAESGSLPGGVPLPVLFPDGLSLHNMVSSDLQTTPSQSMYCTLVVVAEGRDLYPLVNVMIRLNRDAGDGVCVVELVMVEVVEEVEEVVVV